MSRATNFDALMGQLTYRAHGASVQMHMHAMLESAGTRFHLGGSGWANSFWYAYGMRAAGCHPFLAEVIVEDAKRAALSCAGDHIRSGLFSGWNIPGGQLTARPPKPLIAN